MKVRELLCVRNVFEFALSWVQIVSLAKAILQAAGCELVAQSAPVLNCEPHVFALNLTETIRKDSLTVSSLLGKS